MKLKSVLAGAAACMAAASACSAVASAELLNPVGDDTNYVISVYETDPNWKSITGAVITLTMEADWTEQGTGGGVTFYGSTVDWAEGSKEFGVGGDGETTVSDAMMLMRMIAEDGSEPIAAESLRRADIDGDDVISALDARLLLEYLQ